MKFTSTGKASVRSDAVCILFDPIDGAIRYVHRVVTLDGAEETPTPAIEKRALQLAEESGLAGRPDPVPRRQRRQARA